MRSSAAASSAESDFIRSWSENALNLASARVKSARVPDEARATSMARARESLRTQWDSQVAAWALLLNRVRVPGVLELFQDLALLRLLYSRPRAYDSFSRFPAASLAAQWGDPEGARALQALRAASDPRANKL